MTAKIEICVILDENDDGVKQDAYSLVTGKPSMALLCAAAKHLAALHKSTEAIRKAAQNGSMKERN